MGQAKKRGSREERMAKAIDRADVFKPHSVSTDVCLTQP